MTGQENPGQPAMQAGRLDRTSFVPLYYQLQEVLKGTPPPWLRKALMKDQERNFDDALEEEKSHV